MKGIGWRIYRLPGSKEWWLIDHGPGSIVLYAKHLNFRGIDVTTEGNPQANPRAWLYCEGVLYLSDEGTADIVKAAG